MTNFRQVPVCHKKVFLSFGVKMPDCFAFGKAVLRKIKDHNLRTKGFEKHIWPQKF